jgi:hypothetical protein
MFFGLVIHSLSSCEGWPGCRYNGCIQYPLWVLTVYTLQTRCSADMKVKVVLAHSLFNQDISGIEHSVNLGHHIPLKQDTTIINKTCRCSDRYWAPSQNMNRDKGFSLAQRNEQRLYWRRRLDIAFLCQWPWKWFFLLLLPWSWKRLFMLLFLLCSTKV